MSYQQRNRPFAPPEGTIQQGTVVRIEPYGAFVQLKDYRGQGLVHISQLASCKIENVDDAVTLNELIYVKILSVDKEEDTNTGKVRHKIRLSMKYASQEDGTDLDPNNEAAASEDWNRRRVGGEEVDEGKNPGGPSALGQKINSTIGMGVAMDPLAVMKQHAAGRGKKMMLRGSQQNEAGDDEAVLFNGYALVDDNEGEVNNNLEADAAKKSTTLAAPPPQPLKPIGRGRGSTLPAWMTRSEEGPIGDTKPIKSKDKECDEDGSGSVSSRREQKRKKHRSHHDVESEQKSEKRSRHHRSRREDRHRHKRSRSEKSRRRSHREESRRRRKRSNSISSRSHSDRSRDNSDRGRSDKGGDSNRGRLKDRSRLEHRSSRSRQTESISSGSQSDRSYDKRNESRRKDSEYYNNHRRSSSKKGSKRGHRSNNGSRRKRDDSMSSRSISDRSPGRGSIGGGEEVQFKNIEEAKALISKLEKHRKDHK